MSWHSVVTGREVSLRESPLESRRFGLSFSRAEIPIAAEVSDALSQTTQFLRDCDADVVVVRHPAAQVDWFARLRESDRDLIAADTLIYWQVPIGRGRTPDTLPGITATTAETPDTALVEDLVTDMFTGYGNHYLANPLLDPAAALAGYVEWGQRSAVEDTAVILSRDGAAVGVATMETSDGTSEIQLAGIRAHAQQQGLYAHLLAACEDVARSSGARQLVISTQVHNTNVQRAWARFGLEPVGSISTVHAVRPGLLA